MEDGGNALVAAAGFGAIIFYLVIVALVIVSGWKIFVKCGKPGWAFIVPIYNMIVLLEIVKKPLWWILLYLIPIVDIVIAIIVLNRLAKAFGKGVGFTVGLILLSIVFMPILAFGNDAYDPNANSDDR